MQFMFFFIHLFCSCATSDYEEYKFFHNKKYGITEEVLTSENYTNLLHILNSATIKNTILDKIKNKIEQFLLFETKKNNELLKELANINTAEGTELSIKDINEVREILKKHNRNLSSRKNRLKVDFSNKIFKDIYQKIQTQMNTNLIVNFDDLKKSNILYRYSINLCTNINNERQNIHTNIKNYIDFGSDKPITIQKIKDVILSSKEVMERNIKIIHNNFTNLITSIDPKNIKVCSLKDEEIQDFLKVNVTEHELSLNIETTKKAYNEIIKTKPNKDKMHSSVLTATKKQINQKLNLIVNKNIENFLNSLRIYLDGFKNAVNEQRTSENALDTFTTKCTSKSFLKTNYKKFIVFIYKKINIFSMCSIQELDFDRIPGYIESINIVRLETTIRAIGYYNDHFKALNEAKEKYHASSTTQEDKLVLYNETYHIVEDMLMVFNEEFAYIKQQLDTNDNNSKRKGDVPAGCESPFKTTKLV